MGSLKTDEEMHSTGPIGRASSRWSCVTLMVLTVHTLLIATCLTLLFNFRFLSEELHKPTDTNAGIILQLLISERIDPSTIQWSNVQQSLLNFSAIKEVGNIKVDGSVIKVHCQGPYILYPWIEDIEKEEVFNITVVNSEARVLASIPFNTTDKTTWKHRILNLKKNDHISVYVDCMEKSPDDEDVCPEVHNLCLGLNFLLGSACAKPV